MSRTLTVSTLAGPSVTMTCVSTLSISPQRALGFQALTTAATESATGVGTTLSTLNCLPIGQLVVPDLAPLNIQLSEM